MRQVKTSLTVFFMISAVFTIKAQTLPATNLKLTIRGELTGGTLKKGQRIYYTGSNLPFSQGGNLVVNDKQAFILDLSQTPFAEMKVQDLFFAADTTQGKPNEYNYNCFHRIRLSNIKNFMYNSRLSNLELKSLLNPFCSESGAVPPEIPYGTLPDVSLEDSLTGSFAISYHNNLGYLHIKNHSVYEIISGGLNSDYMKSESGYWSVKKDQLILSTSRQYNEDFGLVISSKKSRQFSIKRAGRYNVLQLTDATGQHFDRIYSYLGLRNDSAGISTRVLESNLLRNTTLLSIHNRNVYPVGDLVYQVEWIEKATGKVVCKKEIRCMPGADNQDIFHPLIYSKAEYTVKIDTRPGDEFLELTDEEPDMTKYELRFSLIRHVMYKK